MLTLIITSTYKNFFTKPSLRADLENQQKISYRTSFSDDATARKHNFQILNDR